MPACGSPIFEASNRVDGPRRALRAPRRSRSADGCRRGARLEKTFVVREEDLQILEQIISAVVAAQIVIVDLLHAQGTIDKMRCANAFARVIDALGESPQHRLLLSVLKVLKNSMMYTGGPLPADTAEWLRAVLNPQEAPGGKSAN